MESFLLALKAVNLIGAGWFDTANHDGRLGVSHSCHHEFEVLLDTIAAQSDKKAYLNQKQTCDAGFLIPQHSVLFVLFDEKAAAGLPSSLGGQIPQDYLSTLQLVAQQDGLLVLQTKTVHNLNDAHVALWHCGSWFCFFARDLLDSQSPLPGQCRTKQFSARKHGETPNKHTQSNRSSLPSDPAASGGSSHPSAQAARSSEAQQARSLSDGGHESESDSDDSSVVHVTSASCAAQRGPRPQDLHFEEYRLSPDCLICLEAFKPAQPHVRAAFDGCNHAYCHVACAAMWTGKSNSCPLCKAPVSQLLDVTVTPTARLTSLGALAASAGKRDESVDMDATVHRSCMAVNRVHPVAQAALPSDAGDELTAALQAQLENALCMVCGHDQDDHLLLLCDGCDAGAHTYCVGLSAVPSGDWYCGTCAAARDRNAPSQLLDSQIPADASTGQCRAHTATENLSAAVQYRPAGQGSTSSAASAAGRSVAPSQHQQEARARLRNLLWRRRQYSRVQAESASGRVQGRSTHQEDVLRDLAPGLSDTSYSDSEESHADADDSHRSTGTVGHRQSAAPAATALFAWADQVQFEGGFSTEQRGIPPGASANASAQASDHAQRQGVGGVKRSRSGKSAPRAHNPFLSVPMKKRA